MRGESEDRIRKGRIKEEERRIGEIRAGGRRGEVKRRDELAFLPLSLILCFE